jgi:hypothetical protein
MAQAGRFSPDIGAQKPDRTSSAPISLLRIARSFAILGKGFCYSDRPTTATLFTQRKSVIHAARAPPSARIVAISHCQFFAKKRLVLNLMSTRMRISLSSTGTAIRPPLVVRESIRRLTRRISFWRPVRKGMTSNSQRATGATSCSTGLNETTSNESPDNSTPM